MTNVPASDDGGWLRYPKNGADSSVESAPKREWQSKNVDGRESVRKSHGHHIPPAKGMGERALLLLGLLSLLTAADEVRHADAQHRATSNPSEGHAIETGQREANLLGIADGNVEGAVRVLIGVRLRRQIVIAGILIGDTGNDLAALVSRKYSIEPSKTSLRTIGGHGRLDLEGKGVDRGVTGGGSNLRDRIDAGIETSKPNDTIGARR